MCKSRQVIGSCPAIGFLVVVLALVSAPIAAAQSTWTDLGEAAPGESFVNFLLGIPGNRIIGGTYGSGSPYLFKYDITTATFSPKMPVPGGASHVSRLALGSGGLVYVTTSLTYGQGHLASYNPDTDEIVDLGSVGDEYGEGLAVGSDGKVYVSTCCQGRLSIYDTETQSWTYKGTIMSDQRRIMALTLGPDGNIYGATSRIWVPPYGSAVLFKFDVASQTTTVIENIWPGTREVWNLVTNPVDHHLYGAVGYQITPRLFTFDPAHPELGITDLGEAIGPEDNIGPAGLVVALDGKVYGLVSSHLIMYDFANPGSGIVDLGETGIGARPLTFGADGRLYGGHATSPTHITRNDVLYGEHLPVKPVPSVGVGEPMLDYGVTVSWARFPHDGTDYLTGLADEVKSVGTGIVHGYTRPDADGLGSIDPDGRGPAIWVRYKLSTGEPIYVLYGHTATTWVDSSAWSKRKFIFNCSYTIGWSAGDTITKGEQVGLSAPFYHSGVHQEHLHLSVFKPAQKADGTYYGPPTTGWGYSPLVLSTNKDLAKYGALGTYVDPDDFFANYYLSDQIQ